MLILIILESHFSFLLLFSQLIQVLEDQVLHSLFEHLDLDLMLLIEIFEFSLFVSQLSLFIF